MILHHVQPLLGMIDPSDLYLFKMTLKPPTREWSDELHILGLQIRCDLEGLQSRMRGPARESLAQGMHVFRFRYSI